MRIPRIRRIVGLMIGPALIAGGLATFTLASAVPAMAAGQPVTQSLTPPPPPYYTCKTAGNGVICDGVLSETYGPDDTGLACGSGAGTFDMFDQGIHNKHSVRFYDSSGNLTLLVRYDQFFSQFSNPLTGAAVPYHQNQKTTDVFGVPGDVNSVTETTTGEVNFTVPHLGAVLLNAGRTVFGPDGTLESSSGPQGFIDYFYGNTAALAGLCSALGAS